MFETNQEEATEMPEQKQEHDWATAYKMYQPFAADAGKRFDFHVLMENFQFLDKGSLTLKQLPPPTVLCTSTSAPCAMQMDLTMDRPSPALSESAERA